MYHEMSMPRRSFLLVLFTLAGALCASDARGSAPPEPAVSTPRFEAEISQVPDLQPWGHAAEALCQVWYPKIVAILHSDDRVRPLPAVVKLYFEKEMKGVAYSTGGEIHIAADWVRSHPNDFGMVIHELTHLVQRYPRSRGAGWLVEGIADYVRLGYFEPLVARPHIDFTRAKYTDSYKTTAAFLLWLEAKYGTDLVPRLNAALRAGNHSDALFKELTGMEVSALWSDFAAAQTAGPGTAG
jgi:basic secretory peptidase family protein